MDVCEWCELECVPVGFWGSNGEFVAPDCQPICAPCYDAVRELIRAGNVTPWAFTRVLRQRLKTEREGN